MLDDEDVPQPQADIPLERFRRIASTAVRSSGADGPAREELAREMVDHLIDGWARARHGSRARGRGASRNRGVR